MAGTVQILKIQFRHGNKADLIAADLIPGEPVISDDTNEVGIKTSAGGMLWFAMADGTTTNKAVLASEKGIKGGIPTLPPTLPTSGTIAKLLADGSIASAGFDDFATGIEYGSNANGCYEKHPDGVMECWAAISLTTDGSGYATWTFPAQFISANSLYIPPTIIIPAGYLHLVGGVVTSVSTTSAQYRFLYTENSSIMPGVTISDIRLHAKGMWKN